MILDKGKRPPRTHDIVGLLNAVQADAAGIDFTMDDAVYLNSIYRGRYPTEEGLLPHGEPSGEDARQAVQAASRIVRQLPSLLA